MSFDYNKLRGKIIEVCGSQLEFAKKMKMSERTLSLKMNGKVFWKQCEICKAIDILKLSNYDITEYFFTPKVQ